MPKPNPESRTLVITLPEADVLLKKELVLRAIAARRSLIQECVLTLQAGLAARSDDAEVAQAEKE